MKRRKLAPTVHGLEIAEHDPHALWLEGYDFTVRKARRYEELVRADPGNVYLRVILAGWYFPQQSKWPPRQWRGAANIYWLIRNTPTANFMHLPPFRINYDQRKRQYHQGKQLWLRQIEIHPNKPNVIGNAAAYVQLEDKAAAEKLLMRCEQLDPNSAEWPQKLGLLYELQANHPSSDEDGREKADLAYSAYQRSLDRQTG